MFQDTDKDRKYFNVIHSTKTKPLWLSYYEE